MNLLCFFYVLTFYHLFTGLRRLLFRFPLLNSSKPSGRDYMVHHAYQIYYRCPKDICDFLLPGQPSSDYSLHVSFTHPLKFRLRFDVFNENFLISTCSQMCLHKHYFWRMLMRYYKKEFYQMESYLHILSESFLISIHILIIQ